MGSLAIVSLVSISAILIRFLQMESIVLSDISFYGPGIAAAFGTVSSFATYYGWFRILRGKKKLSAREEGESEAQNQLGDFIQSLPDMFGSLSGGCFSQASTAVLGVSIAVSTVAYVPAVNEVFNNAVNSAEKAIVRTVKGDADDPVEKLFTEEEQVTETEEKPEEMEETVEEAKKQRIAGKLHLRGGTGKIERVVAELMSGSEVAAWAFADSEGNYSFYVTPGDYTVRVRLDGYETGYSNHFELSRKDMRLSEITISPIGEAKPAEAKIAEVKFTEGKITAAKPAVAKPTESKPAETKPVAKKAPVQPTPLIQTKPKAPPTEMPLPPEPPPSPPAKPKKKQQPQEPDQSKTEATKSGFFAGAGSELNNNSSSKKSTAMGGNVVLGYDLNKSFALGLNTIYSYDMEDVSTLESMLMFRYYLPAMSSFLQAEAGGALSETDGKKTPIPLGGLTAGVHLEMQDRWYLEPTLRGGYPFTWGAGVTLGKKFGK
jgi:outer membrane biosynthesis protein TonB